MASICHRYRLTCAPSNDVSVLRAVSAYDRGTEYRFGLKQDKLPKAEIASRVNEMLAWCICRSSPNANRISFPAVTTACGTGPKPCQAPETITAREPMGALDKKLRDRMQLEVVEFWSASV